MRAKLAIVLDCADPDRLAAFWTAALGYRLVGSAANYRSIVPGEGDDGPKLILQGVAEPKQVKNRVHFDLDLERGADLEAEADRLVALGAVRLADEPIAEHGLRWIVLADPAGNEFCICRPE